MEQPASPFFLDCDTGIDDALALAYLLAAPNAELVGIGTVSGNISAAGGARNTLDLLQLAGHQDIPVAVGAHDPLVGSFRGGAPHVHGANGIGEVELPTSNRETVSESAAELLVRLANQYAGELRVVLIGPLTNIAQALRLEPKLPELIAEITIMGGAASAPGNITAVAEANIANDPEAAAEVLAADWDVTLVPLDVTMTNVLEEGHRQELLATDHPMAQALGGMLGYYFGFYVNQFGRACSAMHDPLAAAIAVGGIEVAIAPIVHVEVDTTDGPGRGQTVCDLRGLYMGFPEQPGARCRVVLSLAEEFAPHLLETLQSDWFPEAAAQSVSTLDQEEAVLSGR
ncbi:nucleoside hydrolase [Arthrobacter sp. ISL-30]|uniref:nucleoside hydrolase n=1 Tax=Arthrobacter sp. ISL-30 TaxID=2819109 RepID=UPI001BEBA6B7|nr:nucleoside hydrolase [Arthrobacter sp. ISL-30]MBT2513456.1 nucleoside hydrolase [Arthrobacter sp. ISL-30]